jgi:predicted ATPase/DNA-binding SARP family transcriptional activator/DNA-binding CsgD family transcriptional regulator
MSKPRRLIREEDYLQVPLARAPEAVRVRLLGGFSVSVGHRTIEEGKWRLRKAAGLVKLLALEPGHTMHRERVMDMLWPELDAKGQANNLRQALHVARRTLEPQASAASRCLPLEGDQVALYPEGPLWVDVEAFEEAASTARRSRKEPAAYEAALDLYAGDLLPGDPYEGWTEERREGLRRTYLALLAGLAGLYEGRGELDAAIGALGRVVAEEPTHEGAYIGLMRLYALSGRQQEALQQYEQLRAALSREFGEEPSAQSRCLYEDITADRFPEASVAANGPSPTVPLEAPSHNLPAARSSFVGRERELVEVKRALAMTRLLTLTGAGGSGKTRLALEVSKDLVGVYEDGVWLVELAGLSEGELVPQAVASSLRVREQPGRLITQTLENHLRAKDLLLVLDNCEHLTDTAAHLVDTLLASCPRLRVLATSREPLGVAGEAIWQVPSLPVPPPTDRLPEVGELRRYDAVRLFLNRARLRLPAFDLTPGNAPSVAEVSRKLEGIPLAIELATARVGALTLEQISERLEDSLKLLSAGPRTMPERQRTMRATLEWSFGLLEEAQRELFKRVSVFAGGWTLEAAEAVGSGGHIEEGEVLDLLSGLVDKSLVVTQAGNDGPLRYRMLEPIRQYGRKKLRESGEAEATRRHANFFLGLAEEVEPKINGSARGTWLAYLEAEHDNLRAALRWSVETREAQLGLRLASAIFWFWFHRGYWREGRSWLEEVLGMTQASVGTAARAESLSGTGIIAWGEGDHDSARSWLQKSVALWRELGGKQGLVHPLHFLSMELLGRGDLTAARTLAEESVEISREGEDKFALAIALAGLGLVAHTQKDYAAARSILKECTETCRKTGDRWLLSLPFRHLGYMELREGNYDRATALFKEGLSALWGSKEKWFVGRTVETLAIAAAMQGDCGRATRLFGAGGAFREVVGASVQEFYRSDYDHGVAAARAGLDEQRFALLWAEGRALSIEQAIEYALGQGKPPPATTPAPLQSSADGTMGDILTAREQEVAMLVSRGLSNRQIAEELVVSERTVGTHVSRILKKLNLRSRTQIVAWVTSQRLHHNEVPR